MLKRVMEIRIVFNDVPDVFALNDYGEHLQESLAADFPTGNVENITYEIKDINTEIGREWRVNK